jgi:peptide/nickel transport system substrate-binding protein
MTEFKCSRIGLIFMITIVLVFFNVGCVANEEPANMEDEKPLQELVVAFGQDILTFDTHNYRATQDIIASGMVYETLVEFDQNHQIIPCLAESWEWISPNELKFNLRKDVKFHDGKEFNAECVKFSIERNNASSGTSYSNFIDEVRIVDNYTVICYMETPFGPALSSLANPIVSIMSPEWVEEIGDRIVQSANGTGPYILEEFSPGARAVFVKNPEYWGPEVSLERVEFRPIPETGTRVMALKSGEVDVIENIHIIKILMNGNAVKEI